MLLLFPDGHTILNRTGLIYINWSYTFGVLPVQLSHLNLLTIFLIRYLTLLFFLDCQISAKCCIAWICIYTCYIFSLFSHFSEADHPSLTHSCIPLLLVSTTSFRCAMWTSSNQMTPLLKVFWHKCVTDVSNQTVFKLVGIYPFTNKTECYI